MLAEIDKQVGVQHERSRLYQSPRTIQGGEMLLNLRSLD
jgi:hypothetical protein